MSTINYPRISRKKEVTEKYSPNTFRVISNDAEVLNSGFKSYFPKLERLPDLPVERKPYPADHRFHNPHPYNCDFLRHDVRFINEPICTVYTAKVRADQPNWWPSRTSDEPRHKPPFTHDTVFRKDYLYDTVTLNRPRGGSTRHEANPNKEPVLGIAPVNDLRERNGNVRVHREKISYEHQYNSRLDPNYPIRAKRHGSFVWNKLPQDRAEAYLKSINHPTNLKNVDSNGNNEHRKPHTGISSAPVCKVSQPATTTTTQILRVSSPKSDQ